MGTRSAQRAGQAGLGGDRPLTELRRLHRLARRAAQATADLSKDGSAWIAGVLGHPRDPVAGDQAHSPCMLPTGPYRITIGTVRLYLRRPRRRVSLRREELLWCRYNRISRSWMSRLALLPS